MVIADWLEAYSLEGGVYDVIVPILPAVFKRLAHITHRQAIILTVAFVQFLVRFSCIFAGMPASTRGAGKDVVGEPPGIPPPPKKTPPAGAIPKKKNNKDDTNVAKKKLTLKSMNEEFLSMQDGLAAVANKLDLLLGDKQPPSDNQDTARGSGTAGPTASTGSGSSIQRTASTTKHTEEEQRRRMAMSAYPFAGCSTYTARKRPAAAAAGSADDQRSVAADARTGEEGQGRKRPATAAAGSADDQRSAAADESRPGQEEQGRGFDAGTENNIQRFSQATGGGAWSDRGREGYPPAARRMVDPFEGDLAVHNAVQGLLEVRDRDREMNEPGETLSSFLVAGATLETKIKAKIWSNEFIELGSLIPKNQVPPGLNIHTEAGASSQFSITSSKVRQPSNVAEWHRWFSIYAAVYTQKHPDEAPGLFTYICRIIKLKDQYPNTFLWRDYDTQFRRVRAFVQLPWHILNMQILNDLETPPRLGNSNTSNTNQSNSSNKTGVCFPYNRPTGCSNKACKYTHKCSGCGILGHPRCKCTKSKPGNKE